MKNFTFFLVFFLAAFLSLETMAQKNARGGRSILPIYSSIPSSGLQLWLRADTGVTLNGSAVSQWADQSGNGNNAIQSNTDRQPMLVQNEINGKPVLRFDGVNDMLGLTGTKPMSQISIFMVFKIDSGLVGNAGKDPLPYYPIVLGDPNILGKGYGLSMRNYFSANSPDFIDPWIGEESWLHANSPDIAAFDQWKVLSVVTNQKMWNTTVRSNGVDAVITPQGTTNESLSVPLGKSDGTVGIGGADNVPAGHLIFKGDIAEVIVYDTVLSVEDRLTVEKYLNDKYNINPEITSIPSAGLQLWLKSDAGITHNGSMVSSWADQSGNGNDAIQTDVSRQPLLVPGALNGKPVLRFDGANDRLGLTGTTPMHQISLFLVFKIDSGATAVPSTQAGVHPYYPIQLGDTYIEGDIYGLSMRNDFNGNSPNIIDPFTGGSSWVHAMLPGIASFGNWKVLSVTTDKLMFNTSLRVGGQEAVISPQTNTNMAISVTLGSADGLGVGGVGGGDHLDPGFGSSIFKGDIAEVIVYDTVLSNEDRLSVEKYLNDKYNIVITTVDEQANGSKPERFSLSQNYPNPFNPATTITFSIPVSGFVTLKVYDLLGRDVATLVNETKSPGSYEVNFNAASLSSGVYFYKMQAGNFIATKKFILLK